MRFRRTNNFDIILFQHLNLWRKPVKIREHFINIDEFAAKTREHNFCVKMFFSLLRFLENSLKQAKTIDEYLLEFGVRRGAKICKSDRYRQALCNEYSFAKFGVDFLSLKSLSITLLFFRNAERVAGSRTEFTLGRELQVLGTANGAFRLFF